MHKSRSEIERQMIEEAANELNLKLCHGEEIRPGDLYLAMRNTGPHLLTCQKNNKEDNFIIPKENAYCFDTWECVKVIEKGKLNEK